MKTNRRKQEKTMETSKKYMHWQDGEWYELHIVPWLDENIPKICNGCDFYDEPCNVCHANDYAGNTCCDVGLLKVGVWKKVGADFAHQAQDYMTIPRVIGAYMTHYAFKPGTPTTPQGIGAYCRKNNIQHERRGRHIFYNFNAFFMQLWDDGYFETVVNGI